MKNLIKYTVIILTLFSGIKTHAQCCEKVYALEDPMILKLTQTYMMEDLIKLRNKSIDKGIYVLEISKLANGEKSYSFKYLYDDRFKMKLPNKWSYIGHDILLIYDGEPGCAGIDNTNISNMLQHIGDRVYINPPKTKNYIESRKGSNDNYVLEEFEVSIVGNDNYNVIYIIGSDGRLIKKIIPA